MLRARASRYSGMALSEVSDMDAAAAVIGVDMWMLAVGARTLDNPARFGTPAVMALSASLARAAGWPRKIPSAPLSPSWPTDEQLVAADQYEVWLAETNLPVGLVLSLSLSDLSHGATDPRLAAAVEALRPLTS